MCFNAVNAHDVVGTVTHKNMTHDSAKKGQNARGFTLVEILVSTFVFILVITMVSVVFSSEILAYRSAKAIQRDLENAQFTVNLIAKTLRTSTIISASSSQVRVYDFSQAECIEFRFQNNVVETRATAVTNDDFTTNGCGDAPSGSWASFTTGVVEGAFDVVSSSETPSKVIGQATISMTVYPPGGSSAPEDDKVRIQTSVSLRDYAEAGITF